MVPKNEEQPVMTEQLFIGAQHEHGNLLRVNIIDSKMTDIVKLSLAENYVRKPFILNLQHFAVDLIYVQVHI